MTSEIKEKYGQQLKNLEVYTISDIRVNDAGEQIHVQLAEIYYEKDVNGTKNIVSVFTTYLFSGKEKGYVLSGEVVKHTTIIDNGLSIKINGDLIQVEKDLLDSLQIELNKERLRVLFK